MFAFLKRTKRASPGPLSVSDESTVKRMELEERMAYRKECLYQSIRETFLSMEVISHMYRFKVMPVDERHHRFIAMVDVAKSFVTGAQARTKSFAAIEHTMRHDAYKRFGIIIDGMYWRVSETEDRFERRTRASDPARTGNFEPTVQQGPDSGDGGKPAKALSRNRYQPISAEERAAFMEALEHGKQPPPVRVGELEYESDLMPLEGGIMIGGTQYGKL